MFSDLTVNRVALERSILVKKVVILMVDSNKFTQSST